MPVTPEKRKAPVERKIERPPLEKKGYGVPPKKESEKPQRQIGPGQKEKVSPEQKKREQKEIEEPGSQGGPVEKRREIPTERGQRF